MGAAPGVICKQTMKLRREMFLNRLQMQLGTFVSDLGTCEAD